MQDNNSVDNIASFWNWFQSESNEFVEKLDSGSSSEVATKINRRIKNDFPSVGWEVGPGIEKTYFLAFTFKGDLSNVDLMSALLQDAPELHAWEFRAGRPRREFDGSLRFRNEIGQESTIEMTDWRYTLTEFNSGEFFDIEIHPGISHRLDDAACQQALNIAVQTTLGEVTALRKIGAIERLTNPSKDWIGRSTPFNLLWEHFRSLTSS